MELTKQEKVNLCFIFLTAYEYIFDFLKPFNNRINNLFNGSDKSNDSLTEALQLKYKERKKICKSIKLTETNDLLCRVDLLKKEDIELLKNFVDIRNQISHESYRLYYDNNVDYEFFKLEDLLHLYKSIFLKITKEFLIDNPDQIKEILLFNDINRDVLKTIINELLIDSKFNKLKSIFEDKNEI